MIPAAPETARGLYGAWRLLRGDSGGLAAFDESVDGFWKSFFAAVLTAPGYGLLLALHLGRNPPEADGASVLAIHLLAYVVSWTAFPLVTHYIARGLDREARWVGFVVALNWSKVWQMAIYLPPAVLAGAVIPNPVVAGLISLVGVIAVLVYQWYVTRSALDIPGPTAAGLTAVDLLLGLLITGSADATLGV